MRHILPVLFGAKLALAPDFGSWLNGMYPGMRFSGFILATFRVAL